MKIPYIHRRRLSLPLSLLAAVLLSGGVTLLALWCQPNSFRALSSQLLRQPLLIILNALPVGLLVLAAACLFRNVFWGAALVDLAVCALSIANRVKIEVRDEPVFPRDFALLKEAGSALRSYDIHFPAAQIAAVLLASLALAVLGFFVTSEPFPVERLRNWAGRALGAAASLGVLTGLILTVYASRDLYQSFQVSNAEYVPAVFNDLGFPYAFCHHFTTYLVDRPEGFSRSQAEGWETGDAPGRGGKPVSVVMVMNEAFSDVTDAPAFTWSEETNPLPNLHALRRDPHALSGYVVVPGFAGGTANTEFDVLTGMQANALSASTTSAMRVVNRNLDSLFRVFAADGYKTSFYHPGDSWFYNRENVYRWLGAEETKFVSDMEHPEYKGRWVTDDYAASLIEEAFESAGAPLFHYTTTIQNHMSYTLDKYGADYGYPPLETAAALSEEAETLLRVYAEGVRDADAMLGRLWRYFASREEPVVLVFWGDHLPYLGDNQLGYRQLGIDVFPTPDGQENLAAYQTPYVIWANDAAADALDWESAVEALDLPRSISASFLGAAVLELTGRRDESPWFSFLNDLRRELPVVQKTTCQLPDGSVTGELTQARRDLLQKWRQWSYYKLQYKEIP